MKKLIRSLVLVCFTLAVLVTASYAWFTNSELIEPDLSGYSVAAYFGGGDGSQEKPFEIKNRRHLYNLAWLQFLGYFNKPGENNIKDESDHDSYTQFSFVIDQDIDMEDWVLPPIGTTEYPFIGKLNGQGHTISNLTVSNDFSEISDSGRYPGSVNADGSNDKKKFENAEIIGFVGSIGDLDDMYKDEGITVSSAKNSLTNVKLDDITVHTNTPRTLCGIVAGYINATVEDVGIIKSRLDVDKATAIANQDAVSNYTVAGYATDDYVTKVSNNKTVVMNPKTETTKFTYEAQGNITAWGGSVNFYDMYNNILRPKWDLTKNPGSTTTNPNLNSDYTHKYPTVETITLDRNGNIVSDTYSGETFENFNLYKGSSDYGLHRLTYAYDYVNDDSSNKKIASYSFIFRQGSDSFMYISGNKERTISNAITVTTKYPDAFRITAGTNYLRYSSDSSITNTTSKTGDIKNYWYTDDSGHIYNLKSDNTKLYLNDNNGNLVLSRTATTTWTIDENDNFYLDNFGRYLDYYNGWYLVDHLYYIGYKISQNGNYLNYNSTTSVTGGTNVNNASIWYTTTGNTKYLYTRKNGNYYYLYYSNGIKLTTSTSQTNYFYLDDSGNIRYSTSRCLRYNDSNNSWERGTSGSTYTNTFADAEDTSYRYVEYLSKTSAPDITSSTKKDASYTTVTAYMPLQFGIDVNGNQGVDKKNTGYLVGGSHETDMYFADIRVSEYAMSRISASYTPSSFKKLYTINDSGTAVEITNNVINSSGWTKYTTSQADFARVLGKSSSYVYGLHFMNSEINLSNKIVADWVSINGSDYIANYELPEDCIDFNLMEKGKVNFFAGTYFGGNDSFFSYNEIQRSGTTITKIKRISEVYSDGVDSHSYVYKYSDGTYSAPYIAENVAGVKTKKTLSGGAYTEYSTQATKPTGYNVIFKMKWIEKQSKSLYNDTTNNKIYYFEVPTNDGEYALGSVAGGTGAYLLYLDIGANAQQVERTEIQQKTTVTKYDYAYPNGIAVIIDADSDIDASSSAVVKVTSAGVIQLERISDTRIDATGSIPSSVALVSNYIARGLTLNDVSSAVLAAAVKTTTTIYSNIQYIDYNATTQDLFETNLIRSTTTYSDGTPTVISPIDLSIYYIKNGREKMFDTRDGDTDPTADTIKTSDGLVSWKLYGVYTDTSNVNRNITFRLSGTQPKFTNETDEMVTRRNTALTKLTNTLTTIESYNYASVLEYDYDTAAEKNGDQPPATINNTYDALITSTRDTSNPNGTYYKFTGDNITVTTNNTSGTVIYVTYAGSYTFTINGNTADTTENHNRITVSQS